MGPCCRVGTAPTPLVCEPVVKSIKIAANKGHRVSAFVGTTFTVHLYASYLKLSVVSCSRAEATVRKPLVRTKTTERSGVTVMGFPAGLRAGVGRGWALGRDALHSHQPDGCICIVHP
jgi:hypothetical protein